MEKPVWFLMLLILFSNCGSSTPSSTSTGTSISPTTTTFTVTTPSAPSSYNINGSENPSLTLKRGQTYTFNLTASGHPFYIMSTQGTNTANAYSSGVTGNGTQSGTVTFIVPSNAPTTLYYDCSIHTSMTGTINVTN